MEYTMTLKRLVAACSFTMLIFTSSHSLAFNPQVKDKDTDEASYSNYSKSGIYIKRNNQQGLAEPKISASASHTLDKIELPAHETQVKALTKANVNINEEVARVKTIAQFEKLGVHEDLTLSRNEFREWGAAASESFFYYTLGIVGLNYSVVVKKLATKFGPLIGETAYVGYRISMNTAKNYMGDNRVENYFTKGVRSATSTYRWATEKVEGYFGYWFS